MATVTSGFLLCAALLVVVHCIRPSFDQDFMDEDNEQQFRENIALRDEHDQRELKSDLLEKRGHGCKYTDQLCYKDLYSYGCKDIDSDGLVSFCNLTHLLCLRRLK